MTNLLTVQFAMPDSPDSARRELGQVFEGFEVDAWLEHESSKMLQESKVL